jgi:molybdopterin synthase sulfur carrier subunit
LRGLESPISSIQLAQGEVHHVMPTVLIPTPFRGTTRGEAEIEVPIGTVLECLQSVEEHCPGFLQLCVDSDGVAQRWNKFFLNEVQIESSAALTTRVGESDRLGVLAAVAGG